MINLSTWHTEKTRFTGDSVLQKSFELGWVQLVVHLLNLRDEKSPKNIIHGLIQLVKLISVSKGLVLVIF